MKTVSILSATALGLTLTAGMAFGSVETARGKGYSGIERYESKIEGTINRISQTTTGFWFVDDKPVFITPTTVVSESLAKAELGARVEIFGTYVGRILNAYRIDVKEEKN